VRVVWAGGRGEGRDVVSLIVWTSLSLSRAVLGSGLRPPIDRRPSAGGGDPSAAVWRLQVSEFVLASDLAFHFIAKSAVCAGPFG